MRILTCIGDATSPTTWSGTPFHLLEAARRANFLDAGWKLDPKRLKAHRMFWNAWRRLRRGEHGGFQYSSTFLSKLMKQAPPCGPNVEIVSHFPLFPPPECGSETSYYIDATLAQNFNEYGLASDGVVTKGIAESAMVLERRQYSAAKHIVCMSAWAARSVIETYGIDRHKVHIVPAGSNIDDHVIMPGKFTEYETFTPLRLGFLGKDWRRKNLRIVLQIADVLQSRGIDTEVLAAGFSPLDAPHHPRLRALGYVDKSSELQRFVSFIRACHFTCLFSSAEAFGISNRESLRLGVPVLARDVGGIYDTVPAGCGHLFSPEADAGDIADVIQSYVKHPARYRALRAHIAAQSEEFTWATAVQKLKSIWSGSNTYSYAQADLAHE